MRARQAGDRERENQFCYEGDTEFCYEGVPRASVSISHRVHELVMQDNIMRKFLKAGAAYVRETEVGSSRRPLTSFVVVQSGNNLSLRFLPVSRLSSSTSAHFLIFLYVGIRIFIVITNTLALAALVPPW